MTEAAPMLATVTPEPVKGRSQLKCCAGWMDYPLPGFPIQCPGCGDVLAARIPTWDEAVTAYTCVTCGSRKFDVMDEGNGQMAFTCRARNCGDEWYESYTGEPGI